MPPLPLELIEQIIDIVVQCDPPSLTNCVLVSRCWRPRSTHHIDRIFRTPTVSTFDALHTFLDIVQKHPRHAALTTSLKVIPTPKLNPAFASYVPFHHLACVLPNVGHLILGETLRWSDYLLLYRNGTAGFFFHSVVALDISCHFGSPWDLFSTIQSFKNVKDVRLIYPRHVPPRWMQFRDQAHSTPLRRRPFCRKTFILQNLELSLPIMVPVLEVFGNSVVNLSVICPEMSTVSANTPVGEQLLNFSCSWVLLQTLKMTMPMDSNHDLGKLYPLLAPFGKSDVQCSLFLIRCQEHNAVGCRVEGVSVTTLRKMIPTLLGVDRLEDCLECSRKYAALEDTTKGLALCPYCDLGFSQSRNLKVHCDVVHIGKCSHICGESGCPRAFSRKHDLIWHFQSAHTDLGSPRKARNGKGNKSETGHKAIKVDEAEACRN